MFSYLYQDSSKFKNPKSLIFTSQGLLLYWVNARWKTSWHPEYLMAMNSVADENMEFFPLLDSCVCAGSDRNTC